MQQTLIHTDCRFYKGDIPCSYHKSHNVHCKNCDYYTKIDKRFLIVKLGAMGDVIRTTPILTKIKQVYPESEITWLTLYPNLVPSIVDSVLNVSFENITILKATPFDIVFNFDKDKIACAIANQIAATEKYGYGLHNGKAHPVNTLARHKWLTGLFDDFNKNNRRSYVEEIFEIAGFQFNCEKYILEKKGEFSEPINENRPLIGLNTGCGAVWPTRIWSEEKWVALAKQIKKSGFGCILLGGTVEHEKNIRISQKSGATYLGHFPIQIFINLVDRCDLIVTAVTMAMHIAIGLEKKLVLFNNIFNKFEFELYGLGEIIEPNVECLCCYKRECDIKCLESITIDNVMESINRVLAERK